MARFAPPAASRGVRVSHSPHVTHVAFAFVSRLLRVRERRGALPCLQGRLAELREQLACYEVPLSIDPSVGIWHTPEL